MKILQGDALIQLRTLSTCYIDAIVTDPPYELGFMGKAWDNTGIANSVEMWRECLRVLKPGGHLLSFGGSRTYHRMTCAIEDAGFEIRDQIMWVYGSGFPKSLDIAKSIDKAAGAKREQVAPRSIIGHQRNIGNRRPYMDDPNHTTDSDDPVTAAAAWDGWGTALKPAHEPICLARKPVESTVAINVLRWGTGAINVDKCRIGWPDGKVPRIGTPGWGGPQKKLSAVPDQKGDTVDRTPPSRLGRWPANLIHDGSSEVLDIFPNAPGQCADVKYDPDERKTQNVYGTMKRGHEPSAESIYKDNGATNFAMKPGARRSDRGSAARFFYCAKTSKSERGEGNIHPTVKPQALMRYLCRLVVPPGGIVLDPFTGSGSTGLAAIREGFEFIGIELNPEYIAIARNRLLKEMLS